MDPITQSAIINAAATGGSGIAGAIGARQQRKWQERMTRESWARDERLQNTAVQRKVKDMQMAGLSPTLAVGGATSMASPVTSTGGEHGASSIGAAIQKANIGQIYLDASLKKEQIKNMKILQSGAIVDTLQKMHNYDVRRGEGVAEGEKKGWLATEAKGIIQGITNFFNSMTGKARKHMREDVKKKIKKIRSGYSD